MQIYNKLQTISLSPQLHSAIKKAAYQDDISISEWIRIAANERLERLKSGELKAKPITVHMCKNCQYPVSDGFGDENQTHLICSNCNCDEVLEETI